MSLSGVNGRGKGNSKHRGGIISFLSGAFSLKANVRKKVLFSRTDFLPWEILLINKLDFEKLTPPRNNFFKLV